MPLYKEKGVAMDSVTKEVSVFWVGSEGMFGDKLKRE